MRESPGGGERVRGRPEKEPVNGAEINNDSLAGARPVGAPPPPPPLFYRSPTPHVVPIAATRRAAGSAQRSPSPGGFVLTARGGRIY